MPVFLEYKENYRNDLKLLAILRNPVDRAYSAFWEARKMGIENFNSFEKALEREREVLEMGSFRERGILTYVDHGFYFKQLKGFKESFGDNLRVLIFEEVIQNPKEEMKRLFEWLGVNKEFTPVFKRVNESGVPRYPVLQDFLNSLKLPDFIRARLPIRFRGIKKFLIRKLNVKKISYPPMKEETREYLKRVYERDIQFMETLLDRSLDIWK